MQTKFIKSNLTTFKAFFGISNAFIIQSDFIAQESHTFVKLNLISGICIGERAISIFHQRDALAIFLQAVFVVVFFFAFFDQHNILLPK